jgi:cytochrome c-type protein NapB
MGWCRSCHLARQAAEPFHGNRFKGDPASRTRGARAYPGAPPALPHTVAMRENCLACHGKETHPGMKRNPHPERANCLSCH